MVWKAWKLPSKIFYFVKAFTALEVKKGPQKQFPKQAYLTHSKKTECILKIDYVLTF